MHLCIVCTCPCHISDLTYATVRRFHSLKFIAVADIYQRYHFLVLADRDFVYCCFFTKMPRSVRYVSDETLTKDVCPDRKSVPIQLNRAPGIPVRQDDTVNEEDAFI